MENQPVTPKRPSFLSSMKAVAWSFVGMRSKSGYQDDLAKVNPLHVMLIGISSVFAIVIGLILLVNWVVAK